MLKSYLLSPGPTPVPERVLLAMAQPIIHHRTPQFSAVFADTAERLKKVFNTKQDVLILSSSGTGAMEASVTNSFSVGEKVLVVNGGKFGERWGKIAEAYGLKVEWMNVEWGNAVDPAAIKAALDKDSAIKGVLMQATESSTTVKYPIKEIAQITKNSDVLLVVDGITGVGVFDIPMDEWGIDILISGSQKAFMLPPGLAFIALSEKAWKKVDGAKNNKFYFDLKKERKNLADKTTAYTPAVSLINGLREVLNMLDEIGLDNWYKRTALLAKAAQAGTAALGLKMVTDSPSEAMTGVFLPEGVDGNKLVKVLRDKVGITFAGGQDQWKGKIIRIAQLGYIGEFDIVIALSSIEMALARFGAKVEMGSGVAAVQEVLMNSFEV
ncbi:MAG: alanine--glyoxylate aminotransferase family protein [Nitrospinota bacterium]|nr:alanine--glyoxylate aminotransferase family protein [Nitrospinota bacterium]